MIEFGKSLRLAREGKGLTVAQVADATHMAPKTVLDLEAENFSHIAAAIYGRGFVKLYCEAVGLDPKPFINEFMDIYNGVRDVGIRERKTVPTPPPPPPPPPEPEAPPAATAPEPPDSAGLPPWPDDYALRPDEPRKPAPEQPSATEPPSAAPLSRYAAPVRQDRTTPAIPPTVWRIGVLSAIGLLILWGLLVGVRALYRATSGTAAPTEAPATEVKPAEKPSAPAPAAEKKADAKKHAEKQKPDGKTPADKKAGAGQKQSAAAPKAPRTPQKIPSLYID